MGKLIHACTILPTSKALLNPLYCTMAQKPAMIGLGKQSEVRAALLDLRTMIKSIADRPTHVFELVERPLASTGMVDASSTGVGGIWMIPKWPPIVYRHPWPPAINDLYRNKTLTNSDLEMAGILVAWMVLESCTPLCHQTTSIFSDNSPAVHWTQRLISRSEQPTSARLLRALAMRARTLESQVPMVPHWAGKNNRPADFAPRSFDPHDKGFSPDPALFLSFFNSAFPLPQKTSWRLQQIPPGPLSLLMLTLAGKRLPLQQWTYPPAYETGDCGRPTAETKVSLTHSSQPATTSSAAPSWWALLPDTVQESLAEATKSAGSL